METGKRPQTKEQRQKQIISRLKNRIKKQDKIIAKQAIEIVDLKEKLEKALTYIDELQLIVFGKKKKKDNGDDDDFNLPKKPKSEFKKRSKSSYRRKTPKEKDVTDIVIHSIDQCPDCGHQLEKFKFLEFFIEDILPMKEWFKVLKKTIKEIIVSGYCPHCKKRFSKKPIPKQKCSLGTNIRQLVVFQSTVCQLSNNQIIDFADGCLRFKIAKGEICKILEEQAQKLRPAYENLKVRIRDNPVNQMDESGWKVAKQGAKDGDYVWVTTPAKSTDTVFEFGKNRGGGNIKNLQGDDYTGITVSDDYNGYKNAFEIGKHALCWAHPFRKFRLLATSKNLNKKKKEHCRKEYIIFAKLYDEIKKVVDSPFKRKTRLREKNRLMKQFLKMTQIKKDDPLKLKKIKKRMKEQRECYFVCVLNEGVPMDNNKAERALRHLVIKRKKSFGSKTSKGAKILSILYSVGMSLWWKDKQNFFKAYEEALVN